LKVIVQSQRMESKLLVTRPQIIVRAERVEPAQTHLFSTDGWLVVFEMVGNGVVSGVHIFSFTH
jgi:hypothetical protein